MVLPLDPDPVCLMGNGHDRRSGHMESTDDTLTDLAVSGDHDAFNELQRRWEPKMLGRAFQILRDHEDARDACQEAFLKAFKKISGFKRNSRFSTWMYMITTNTCLDRIKKGTREIPTEPLPPTRPDPPDLGTVLEDIIYGSELAPIIARAVATLRRKEREAFLLFFSCGMTLPEIAAHKGWPIGTVKTRVYTARHKMQETLTQLGLAPTS